MITYYPDGSWSTDEIASYEVNDVRQSIKRLGDEHLERVFETLVREYIDLADSYGSSNYVEECDHDCEYCDFSEDCDECDMEEDEDEAAVEDKGAPNHTPDIHVEEVDQCRDCEFHVAGFPCSKTTRKKKGCNK